MAQHNKSIIVVLVGLGFVLSGLIFLISCDDDKGTNSVAFKPPGTYDATYRVVRHWLSDDSLWSQASVRFDFRVNDTFYMWADADANTGDFHLCSVKGTYVYHMDTLTLDVTNFNLDQRTCAEDAAPDGVFPYFRDREYFIFEIRDTALYQKIELAGK
jgi:hypothetical protein